MVRGKFLLAVYLLVFHQCLSNMRCDLKIRNKISEKFRNCTGHYKNEYKKQMLEKEANIEISTCELVDNVVNDCGDIWKECHTLEEVREIKNRQVKALVEKNRNAMGLMEKCGSIKKYR